MSRKHRIHLGDTVHDLDHKIGDTVYLRVRDEPIRGLITGLVVRPGSVLYAVVWGDTAVERDHYEFELTTIANGLDETEDLDDESESTCQSPK